MIITVGFSRTKHKYKIGSAIISESEKRKYSHTYFVYKCLTTEMLMVSHAANGMVHELTYENFLKHNIPMEEINIHLTEEEYVSFIKWCKNQLGTKYSILQIILLAIKKLSKLELPVNNGLSQVICSEYCIRGLNVALTSNLGLGRNLDYITPSDINTIIKSEVSNERISSIS